LTVMSVPLVVTEKAPGPVLVVGQSFAPDASAPDSPPLASGPAAPSEVEDASIAPSSPPLEPGPTDPLLAPELDPPLDEPDAPSSEAGEPPVDPQARGGTTAPTTEMNATSRGRCRWPPVIKGR
jgi:molecular chaperone DnaK